MNSDYPRNRIRVFFIPISSVFHNLKESDLKISIVGVGRIGGALALALARKGFSGGKLAGRNRETAENLVKSMKNPPTILEFQSCSEINSDVILIATQDSEIATAADLIPVKSGYFPIVLHTSGSLSSEILRKIKNSSIGSLHPLVSISDAFVGADRFEDVFFAVEGDDKAVDAAQTIAKVLGGKPFAIETKTKALYHAAAVLACGHFVALFDSANEMLEKCGIDKALGKEILLPLVKSTIANLEVQSAENALTGTFARLDQDAFQNHVKLMKENISEDILEVYLQLGLRSLHLVKANEVNREKLDEMRENISLAKRNLKC